MQVFAVCHAFDGGDFTTLGFNAKYEAGTNHAAIQGHGAGTAVAGTAAFFRAGKANAISQGIQQGFIGRAGILDHVAINFG
jgi:hypothetical protein